VLRTPAPTPQTQGPAPAAQVQPAPNPAAAFLMTRRQQAPCRTHSTRSYTRYLFGVHTGTHRHPQRPSASLCHLARTCNAGGGTSTGLPRSPSMQRHVLGRGVRSVRHRLTGAAAQRRCASCSPHHASRHALRALAPTPRTRIASCVHATHSRRGVSTCVRVASAAPTDGVAESGSTDASAQAAVKSDRRRNDVADAQPHAQALDVHDGDAFGGDAPFAFPSHAAPPASGVPTRHTRRRGDTRDGDGGVQQQQRGRKVGGVAKRPRYRDDPPGVYRDRKGRIVEDVLFPVDDGERLLCRRIQCVGGMGVMGVAGALCAGCCAFPGPCSTWRVTFHPSCIYLCVLLRARMNVWMRGLCGGLQRGIASRPRHGPDPQ